MKKVAIFMSDFHLGQMGRMEEFYADKEFAELLARLSLEHANEVVDLVLLGDVMDLWTTIVDEVEITALKSADIPLYFPVVEDNRKHAVEQEMRKAEAILKAHPAFFTALGLFLLQDPRHRRVLYIPGNHDHSGGPPRATAIQASIVTAPAVRRRPIGATSSGGGS
jgi:UDP-2,3-diacylglucosamine pyrophosphatase LpxH